MGEVQSRDPAAKVAVVVPCFNEEATVARVVDDFQKVLPDASIYVFDNNSTDRTAEVARAAGAVVIPSSRQGKGSVLQHMSRVIDADVYVIVDGDDTYPAEAAPELLRIFDEEHVDMLVGSRLTRNARRSFRPFHRFGNRLISRLVSGLFSVQVTDILSGYRLLSRDLVQVVRLRTSGFEVETELTLQALAKRFTLKEVPVAYGTRPEGSVSKLTTWSDGLLIVRCFFLIFKDYKPLFFFSAIAAVFAVASLAAGYGPVAEFYRTGLVYRVPRAVLAAGLGLLATLSLAVGLILDTVSKYHAENIELWKQQFRGRGSSSREAD